MSAPAVGTKMPDFNLKLAAKDGVTDFKLSEHLGKGPIVIAFYPLAFSGICTKEVCDMRDHLGSLAGLHAQVYGMSADTHFANKAFAEKENLGFGLLSDPNRDVIGRFWPTMPTQVAGVSHVAKRGAVVLNADGTVKWAFASDDVKMWVGAEEIRKHLA